MFFKNHFGGGREGGAGIGDRETKTGAGVREPDEGVNQGSGAEVGYGGKLDS